MTAANFEQSLKYVLLDEGGNDDDPQDHGGRTSRGITQREYDAWCRLNSKTKGDVWYAPDSDIRSVYLTQYWEPYCDSLPSGVDYLFFDISVNAGRTQAVRQFQKALGLKVDGMFGINTRDAITSADPVGLIRQVSDKRRSFYRALSQFPRYGKGWLNRVDHSERMALGMASGSPEKATGASVGIKASQDTPMQPSVSPQTSGAVGTSSIGLGQLFDMMSKLISDHQDVIKYSGYILLGFGFISLGYAAWGMYKQNKINKDI